MAYPIVDGSIAEVSVEMSVNGQNCMSLFHYYLEEEDPVTDGAALLVELLNWFAGGGGPFTAYEECIPDTVIDMSVYGQWITPTRYRYEIAAGGPFVGDVNSPPYPPNVSAAITKFGEAADRHNIGTLHMPAVPTTFIVDGMISAVGLGAYGGLASVLSNGFVSAAGHALSPVIFNRASPGDSPYIIGAFTQLTSRVNRRRTVGLGS